MRSLPIDTAIGLSDQNNPVRPRGERCGVCVGHAGKRAVRSGLPKPAAGWMPAAGPELRTGPDRGRAARRPPADGSTRRRRNAPTTR